MIKANNIILFGKIRLRSSKILVLGMSGIAAEVCKNIVLSGIGSLTIVDDHVVTITDICANFFLSDQDVGRNVSGS